MASDARERRVDKIDAAARWVVTLGGGVTIFSVILMLVFIFIEVYPLLSRPETLKKGEWMLWERSSPLKGFSIGGDEYKETAFRLVENGNLEFISLKNGNPIKTITHPGFNGEIITASSRSLKHNVLFFGTKKGGVGFLEVKYQPVYTPEGRRMEPEVKAGNMWQLDERGGAINKITGAKSEDFIIVAGVTEKKGLSVLFFNREEEESNIRRLDTGGMEISSLALKSNGETLTAGTNSGEILVFSLEDGTAELQEKFAVGGEVSSLVYLIGDESLIVGGTDGTVSQWLQVRHLLLKNLGNNVLNLGKDGPLAPEEERKFLDTDSIQNFKRKFSNLKIRSTVMHYLKVRDFTPHNAEVDFIAPSPRDKGFISVSRNGKAAYHYATTGKTYDAADFKSKISRITFTPKSNGFLVLREDGMLLNYHLEEEHPDVTAGVLFKPVWYEGYPEPALVWQSTGGTDEYEPKFSLWPLIFGTIKGTLYAMLFSVPISILGALYLSQMAPPGLRNFVKPLIEIMAAIPSVVVGFLAGLWLSPLMSANLMSCFLVFFSIPAVWFFLVCSFWVLPDKLRPDFSGKYELFWLLPFMLLGVALAAGLGSAFEQSFFGGDLKEWLYRDFGILYDPRNCLVVGFALGFAVIPIIFTISEDALSSVPQSLASAAFALAASKWQTAIYVVLPAASPGIFAAIMLGLGRAVGETMIVLMATGNTPIMDINIFNGLRAMSASIAVEMPEAPAGGSLYRLLFLTGLLLFIFTFVINTMTAVVSQRLREKYSRF